MDAEGVAARDAWEDEELEAASIEKTSLAGFLGAAWIGVEAAMAPSLRGASAGLDAPVEFQRSAKASDMEKRRPTLDQESVD